MWSFGKILAWVKKLCTIWIQDLGGGACKAYKQNDHPPNMRESQKIVVFLVFLSMTHPALLALKRVHGVFLIQSQIMSFSNH